MRRLWVGGLVAIGLASLLVLSGPRPVSAQGSFTQQMQRLIDQLHALPQIWAGTQTWNGATNVFNGNVVMNGTCTGQGCSTLLPGYTGSSCTNQFPNAISSVGNFTCVSVTSAYIDTTVAKTGVDINTASQVTVTHLASPLSAAQGGTGVNNTGIITLGGNFTTAGPYAATFTLTTTSSVTLPASGILLTTIGVGTGLTFNTGSITALGGNFSTIGGFNTAITVTGGTTVTLPTTGTLLATTGLGTGLTFNTGSITALGGNFSTIGAFSTAITVTGATTVTLPTTGTLLATTGAGTGLTFNTGSITALGGNFSIAGAFTTALTVTGATTVTLPTTGTLLATTGVGTGLTFNTGSITALGGNFSTSGAFTIAMAATGNTSVTLPTAGTITTTGVITLASLKQVGTLTNGTWQSTIIGNTYGGTGLNASAVTDGQLLIGRTSDNTFNLATLTAGSNVTITNAGSAITVAATSSSPNWNPVYATKSAAYTAIKNDWICATGSITITLTTTTSAGANAVISVKNCGSGTITVSRISPSTDVLDGATTQTLNPGTLNLGGDQMNFMSDNGGNWYVF